MTEEQLSSKRKQYDCLLSEYNESSHAELQYERLTELGERLYQAGRQGIPYESYRAGAEGQELYGAVYSIICDIFYAGMVYRDSLEVALEPVAGNP